ncbi:MAG: hypothetical protein AAF203_04285 [Pseudomonadota bacterium]
MSKISFIFLLSQIILFFGTAVHAETGVVRQGEDLKISHYPDAQQDVEQFLAEHEVADVVSYCQVGKFNCRSVVFFKNKMTGDPVKSFEDRFVSSEKISGLTATARSVASRAFFIEQPNGRFNTYVQDIFKNEIEITQVLPQNQNIRVRFDNEGFPRFTAHFLVVGTTNTIKARVRYQKFWASLSNKRFETDPSKVFNLRYTIKP